ncbi:MAG TPA: DUF2800 domain-containing protein [Stellaceae bacterium]|nr:DUF2800 domain-containing protein [Terriglobia bacterium]HEV2551762.1 DUF2800 domain-containing protein [Stellaceae bacterium]
MSEVIVIPPGAHSVLGPSSAERWLNCPGSVLLPGPAPQTEYAAEGTAAHTLSEWVRNGRPLSEFKGKILQVGEYQFKVGKNMTDSVQTFVDSVSKLPGAPLIEGRVAYEELVPGGFGTLDDARLQGDTCVITDFKHGKGVAVDAKDNAQLKLYALGLHFTYGWIGPFTKFLLRISQPRLASASEEETSLGKLLQWGWDVVRPAAARALLPGAEIKAGSWCKFCKAKETCSVRAAYKVSFERSPDSPDDAFINLED